ncbi:MAG TPA: hypothetical protein VFG45_11170 [Candidatus Nitrosocosmicus sp.]|nr:hypothetical protein [Candidatus Nitrosocosmicus sp.]
MINDKIDNINLEKNIDFILSHFNGQESLFPRSIMTSITNGQIIVNDKNDIVKFFQDAKFFDCRINGFPYFDNPIINRLCPSLIFIDLDLSYFLNYKYPQRKLDISLKQTLKKIKDEINGYPTVLWTGGGYHIYQPVKIGNDSYDDNPVLENFSEFKEFIPYINTDLTTEYMRIASKYFTDNKNDHKHNPSTKSCLLRIPGTINSKYKEQVKIIQKWDGNEPYANDIILYLLVYLNQIKIDYKARSMISPFNRNNNLTKISWIEKLLVTSIEDHRKYCLWKILIPYLVNIRKLDKSEIISLLTDWLDRCDKEKRIDFRYPRKIEEDLRYVRGYLPISKEKLKIDNFDLFKVLKLDY